MIGTLISTKIFVAVDFTVLVVSTNGQASQGLLQGFDPFKILMYRRIKKLN